MRLPKSPRVNITITKEIINVAAARDSQHCMIADAVKAAYPKARSIAVDLATVRFTDPEKAARFTYLTPRIAQVELVKFDQGLVTKPFSFVLRNGHVTRSGLRKTETQENQKKGAEAKKKKRVSTEGLKKARLVRFGSGNGQVPDRVGGATPPTQKTSDGVPFSRRRAFGLRALKF